MNLHRTALPISLLLLSATLFFSACEKDTEGDGLTCADLTDNVIIIDGKEFTRYETYPVNCGPINPYGTPRQVHGRALIYGSGSSLIMPDLVITLCDVPAVGTTTYQLDNGMWLLNADPATGKATLRVNNHEETPELQENWFSDSESGTVEVTADASGNITYNFSVELVKNGGQLTDRKTVCGQNITCNGL
ncbi:MAG: hypothetical protein K9J06_02665 [Flavobacteriales bacterium]|nr:hypothetical protein [Flavobacteriales bacterium]